MRTSPYFIGTSTQHCKIFVTFNRRSLLWYLVKIRRLLPEQFAVFAQGRRPSVHCAGGRGHNFTAQITSATPWMWTHVKSPMLLATVGAAVPLLRCRCREILGRVGQKIRLRRAFPSTKASCPGGAWPRNSIPPFGHCRAGSGNAQEKF